MKRIKKILCGLLVLLLLGAGVLAWWQRDNLKALYQAKTTDAETILAEAAVKSEARQKELEEYGVTLKTPTREEMDTLLNGGQIESAAQDETTPTDEALSEQKRAVKDIIERCIRELYDCETALMARLGKMKQAAIDEWNALPDGELTYEKQLEIGRRGLSECYKLEVEVDAQVQGILAKYRAELESIDADTAPMDTLWKHYCEEKASAKAYYFNKYL